MPDKPFLLDALRSEVRALAGAADRGLDRPLPSCPGWTESTLLGHLGLAYISIARNVAEGKGEDIVNELEDLQLAPEYEDWVRRELTQDAVPHGLIEWFRSCAERLEDVLASADPDASAWTWFPPDQTAGFWMRRMAHETSIHRWDAQLPHGDPDAIDSELAADGVDEVFHIYLPHHCRPKTTVTGSGERYLFHRTDGPGDWLVHFEGDSMAVERGSRPADATIQGPASDLVLFLWHRIHAERLDVEGDTSFVDHYFELVPPD